MTHGGIFGISLRRRVLLASAPLLAFLAGGCPITGDPGDDGSGLPVLDVDGNFSFDTATPLTLVEDKLAFRGSVDSDQDLDIFDLGTLARGDRVTIDLRASGDVLDPVLAVYNDAGELVAFNDDRTEDGSDLNPLVDFIIRGADGPFFLGVYSFSGETTGGYRVDIAVTRGVGVPDTARQIIYLDWEGGDDIDIPNVGTFNLPPFNATQLGPFTGLTSTVQARVLAIVEAAYAGFDLEVRSSATDPRPTQPHSVIYFGGSNDRAFAISQQIDAYNADLTDAAIIFTESFRGAFRSTPSIDEVSTAVGNTVAHEIGHLLGLVHTADCEDLMDTTCSNERLLELQAFTTAELDQSVFPIGVQDAVELLSWTLGLSD